MTKPIDPELLEAMAQHRTSRRRFLGMGGLALDFDPAGQLLVREPQLGELAGQLNLPFPGVEHRIRHGVKS